MILAGLFAAAMSTIDSGINGVSSVIVYDWLGGRQLSLRVSRLLTGALGVLVVLAALYVDARNDNVINMITAIAGTSLGMLLAVFLLGMLVPRANLPGVICGVLSGGIALFFARRLAVPDWWLGVFSMFPTFLVGWGASYLFPPPDKKSLVGTLLRDPASKPAATR